MDGSQFITSVYKVNVDGGVALVITSGLQIDFLMICSGRIN